jgi:subtilisin family serine protease
MVDGPVNDRAPSLAGQGIVRRFFFSRDTETDAGHGTAIAALLIGRGPAYTGLLPGARLYAAAAFTGRPAEDGTRGTALAVVRALDWLVGRRVTVINASFTGPDNPLLHQAIRKIARQRIGVVAAAGNHGPDGPPLFPAAYDEVIAVTAVDRFRHPYRQASRGDYIDVAAPGVRVPVPCPDGRICYRSGTSYAAPYCTAVVATLASQKGRRPPVPKIIARLRKDAVDISPPGRDNVTGWGLVRWPGNGRRHHK